MVRKWKKRGSRGQRALRRISAMFDDNKKIGIGLCLLGMFCLFLGIMLIFDRFLLSIGNVAFLMGLCFLLGLQKTGRFFLRKEKAVGHDLSESTKRLRRSQFEHVRIFRALERTNSETPSSS